MNIALVITVAACIHSALSTESACDEDQIYCRSCADYEVYVCANRCDKIYECFDHEDELENCISECECAVPYDSRTVCQAESINAKHKWNNKHKHAKHKWNNKNACLKAGCCYHKPGKAGKGTGTSDSSEATSPELAARSAGKKGVHSKCYQPGHCGMNSTEPRESCGWWGITEQDCQCLQCCFDDDLELHPNDPLRCYEPAKVPC